MSHLYLLQLPNGYALGTADARPRRKKPNASVFSLFTLEGTPLCKRKGVVRVVDRVGTFADDDELFDLFDHLAAAK
jgi:hypothetical protein